MYMGEKFTKGVENTVAEGKIAHSPFPKSHLFYCFYLMLSFGKDLTLSQTTTCRLAKLKELAGDNFKVDKNGRKFSKYDRKHRGKRRNCLLRAISPFPTVFSKDLYCRHIKTRACLVKG